MVVPAVWFAILLFSTWFDPNDTNHLTDPALLLLWLPSPLGGIVLTAVYWRTSRTVELPGPTRRFWRHQTLAGALVGLATVAQGVDVLTHPAATGQRTGPGMLAVDTAAIVVIMWSLYRLPLGHQSRGERFRVALDAGTVVLATSIFFLHFHTMPLLTMPRGNTTMTLVSSAMVTTLGSIVVFAVAKVVLSSYAYIDKGALRLFACAIIAGCVSSLPQPYIDELPGKNHLLFTTVSIPMVMFFAAWAGERQRMSVRRAGAGAARRRRPFSILPYVAVAAVDALLIGVLCTLDIGGVAGRWATMPPSERLVVMWDPILVGATAVLLTGLVVLRQLTAMRDNRRLLDQLDHGATHDALTQLPNRRLFHERLQQALADPGGGEISVALIDLDDFKIVNDNLGHEAGDALLVDVAQRLTGCVRVTDTVARLGGDEFVVIFDGIDPAAASAAAQRIIDALGPPVVAEGHELLIRASIGIADGCPGTDPSDLLRQADIAMYAAKGLGGSRYLTYEPGMAGAVADHMQLGVELRRAIIAEQFCLLYQPITELGGGRLIGVEALVRWNHPERGVIPPAEFIPLAERNGLIVPLGRWVVREACRQFAAWSAEHGAASPARLNVNVSARELREPGFADDVATALAATQVPAHRLVLEVTETTVLQLGEAVTNLTTLREMGVRVALDDFGTGQSTLSLLQNCQVDELKLDKSFTQAQLTGERTIAAAVLQLAGVLGLDVVAEGVETPQQADRLRDIGYHAAQGYPFSLPLSAAQLAEVLADMEGGACDAIEEHGGPGRDGRDAQVRVALGRSN
jgi:diguanylate cyclase (GGDEF)-like protein